MALQRAQTYQRKVLRAAYHNQEYLYRTETSCNVSLAGDIRVRLGTLRSLVRASLHIFRW